MKVLLAVRLARGAIEYTIARKPKPMITLTPVFGEKRGVFVTLTRKRPASGAASGFLTRSCRLAMQSKMPLLLPRSKTPASRALRRMNWTP